MDWGLCVSGVSRSQFFVPFASTFSPNSFRFLKAIRHCRICQLRSSKRFWVIAVTSKALQKYLILFYLSSSLVVYFFPVAFRNPRAIPRVLSRPFESDAPILLPILVDLTRRVSSFSPIREEMRSANSPPSFVPLPHISLLVPSILFCPFSHCDIVIKATYHAPVRATKE